MEEFYEAIKAVCLNYIASAAVPAVMEVTVENTPPDVDITQIRVTDNLLLPLNVFVLSESVANLKRGDKLIALRAAGGQKYYLLNKVG